MSHSLTLSESSTPRVGRGRVQLLLILAVVIGPMLLASAMYHWRFWVPEGRSYHGELIGGALSRADLGLPKPSNRQHTCTPRKAAAHSASTRAALQSPSSTK